MLRFLWTHAGGQAASGVVLWWLLCLGAWCWVRVDRPGSYPRPSYFVDRQVLCYSVMTVTVTAIGTIPLATHNVSGVWVLKWRRCQ